MIRPATPADRPAIARLLAASWRDAYRDDLPAEFLGSALDERLAARWGAAPAPDELVLVAGDPPDLAGFVCVLLNPDDSFIDNLHADPALRGRGTGTALMRAAARALLDRGRATAHLKVMASNEAALRLYRRLGGQVSAPAEVTFHGMPVLACSASWPDLTGLSEDAG